MAEDWTRAFLFFSIPHEHHAYSVAVVVAAYRGPKSVRDTVNNNNHNPNVLTEPKTK